MKVLHPFMPYVTEELFQRLPKTEQTPESICIASYPSSCPTFEGTEHKVALLQTIVKEVRSLRAQLNIPTNASPEIFIRTKQVEDFHLFREGALFISTLGKLGNLEIIGEDAADPEKCLKTHVSENVQIFTNVIGLIDLKLQIDRLNKRQEKLEQLIDGQRKKMEIKDYEEKVKEEIRKENQAKLTEYQTEKAENEKSLHQL